MRIRAFVTCDRRQRDHLTNRSRVTALELASRSNIFNIKATLVITVSEMSTSEVFKEFYCKLVETLPMNDALFIAKLYSCDLLPDDIKEHVHSVSLPTKANKAMYFLDHVIKPSVTTGVGSSFDQLLNVMEDSEHQGVKEVAKLIRTKRSNSDNG